MLVGVGDKQENGYWDCYEAAWVSYTSASAGGAPPPEQLDESAENVAQSDEAADVASV